MMTSPTEKKIQSHYLDNPNLPKMSMTFSWTKNA